MKGRNTETDGLKQWVYPHWGYSHAKKVIVADPCLWLHYLRKGYTEIAYGFRVRNKMLKICLLYQQIDCSLTKSWDGLQLYLRRTRIISRKTVTLTGLTSPTADHLLRLRYPSTQKVRQSSCPNFCHNFDKTRPPTCSVVYDPGCRIRIGADISMNIVAICQIQRKVHTHSSSQSVRTFQMGRSAPGPALGQFGLPATLANNISICLWIRLFNHILRRALIRDLSGKSESRSVWLIMRALTPLSRRCV